MRMAILRCTMPLRRSKSKLLKLSFFIGKEKMKWIAERNLGSGSV
jgi:hypothetical protein